MPVIMHHVQNIIRQLGENNAVLKAYQFVDIFPITVGDIALSYDTGDTIEEFDVEFAVQSIRISGPADSPITSTPTNANPQNLT